MATLSELKDWLEQGGKICRESSRDLVYSLNEEDELRDKDDGVATYQSLIASDWEKVEEDTRWKPAECGFYYFVCDDANSGVAKCAGWTGHSMDHALYNSYNCFKTREEAEQARALWLAERELRSLADGGDWFITYDSDGDAFESLQRITHRYSPYTFSTKEKADAAIEKLGKDKLKLIYGV